MRYKGGKWALIGPGAIGLNYGAQLLHSGIDLHVLARSDFEVLRERGIELRFVDPTTAETKKSIKVEPSIVGIEAAEISEVDVVVIAAKSTVNEALIESLTAVIVPEKTVVVTLQNGMGNAEFFAKYFPKNPILSGLCFVCANRVASGVVENYLPGRVEIGSLRDQWPEINKEIVEVFNTAGIRADVALVFDAALWRKLCWNIPFNGLSIAAGGITTDLILADSELASRARCLMEEVRAAAVKSGHAISDGFIDGQFKVTAKMGAYRPSSLIDFVDGCAVEVDSIWGEPLRRGQAMGVSMPELEVLYAEIVRAIEARGFVGS